MRDKTIGAIFRLLGLAVYSWGAMIASSMFHHNLSFAQSLWVALPFTIIVCELTDIRDLLREIRYELQR